MADPLFGPEARLMLEKNDTAAMKEFCESLHPVTVAETLEDFEVEQIWTFLASTDIEHQAEIFAYFPLENQIEMVEGAGHSHVANLIGEMSSDDRAELLRNLEQPVRESLLRLVDDADRRDIARLVDYPEDSAGALMTTDYAWLPVNISAGEAIQRLRVQAPDSETIYYIFIVDEQRRMLGVVSLRDLIMARPEARLSTIMETQVVSVPVTAEGEEVAQEMARYDLLALPVVDEQGRLVGIITYDDVIDVVVEEATEDVHRMGAVGPLEESYLETPFTTLWRKRAFWLAWLFFAELLTFWAMESFEHAIAQVVVLSLFVPLCISTGGNSGSQAATLITRSVALGQVEPRDWHRVFRHEIFMGIALGATLGLMGFVRGITISEDLRSSAPPRREAFDVIVPTGTELTYDGGRKYDLPAEAVQRLNQPNSSSTRIIVPEGTSVRGPYPGEENKEVYEFPENCVLPRSPIDPLRLGLVVGLSVAAICLWGTLVGSLLPLLFKRLNIDPGIASSPFVATFVDVTGIIVYFSVAQGMLGPYLA